MRLLSIVVLAVVIALPAIPAFATTAPPPSAIAACLSEAQWPVTRGTTFADGSARTREALLNGYNPAVSRFSSLCRRIATAPAGDRVSANSECRRDTADDKTTAGNAVRAHLDRMAARCADLVN